MLSRGPISPPDSVNVRVRPPEPTATTPVGYGRPSSPVSYRPSSRAMCIELPAPLQHSVRHLAISHEDEEDDDARRGSKAALTHDRAGGGEVSSGPWAWEAAAGRAPAPRREGVSRRARTRSWPPPSGTTWSSCSSYSNKASRRRRPRRGDLAA